MRSCVLGPMEVSILRALSLAGTGPSLLRAFVMIGSPSTLVWGPSGNQDAWPEPSAPAGTGESDNGLYWKLADAGTDCIANGIGTKRQNGPPRSSISGA